MSAPQGLAHHEAAHCVALAHFGWTIRDVTIIPNGRHAGLVRHGPPPPDAGQLEDYVIAAVGYEAERKLLGGQDTDGETALEDFALARRRLEAAIPDLAARVAVQKRATRLARHVVSVHWPLIDALAARLERDRRLSGQQVLRLVQEFGEKAATR